jgi:hypothetical protein
MDEKFKSPLQGKPFQGKNRWRIFPWIVLAWLLVSFLSGRPGDPDRMEISYTALKKQVHQRSVVEITMTDRDVTAKFKETMHQLAA